MEIQKEWGSFYQYLTQFHSNYPIVNHYEYLADIPAKTELSDLISKDMKKRGFKFTGSTIIYAFLQATGLVMDHQTRCFRYQELTNKPK